MLTNRIRRCPYFLPVPSLPNLFLPHASAGPSSELAVNHDAPALSEYAAMSCTTLTPLRRRHNSPRRCNPPRAQICSRLRLYRSSPRRGPKWPRWCTIRTLIRWSCPPSPLCLLHREVPGPWRSEPNARVRTSRGPSGGEAALIFAPFRSFSSESNVLQCVNRPLFHHHGSPLTDHAQDDVSGNHACFVSFRYVCFNIPICLHRRMTQVCRSKKWSMHTHVSNIRC